MQFTIVDALQCAKPFSGPFRVFKVEMPEGFKKFDFGMKRYTFFITTHKPEH